MTKEQVKDYYKGIKDVQARLLLNQQVQSQTVHQEIEDLLNTFDEVPKYTDSVGRKSDPTNSEHRENIGHKGLSNAWFALVHKAVPLHEALKVKDGRDCIETEWKKSYGK